MLRMDQQWKYACQDIQMSTLRARRFLQTPFTIQGRRMEQELEV